MDGSSSGKGSEPSSSTRMSDKTPQTGPRKLEEYGFYHGMLSSKEANELLKEEGEWLVRIVQRQDQVRIVITIRWNDKLEHAALKYYEGQGWKASDQKFYASVTDMIRAMKSHKLPVSKSGAVLGRPIKRPSWMLCGDNLMADKKVGEGNFGEVWTGKLKYKGHMLPVAFKICREQLNEQGREQLVEEAKKMRYYLHKNVLRFIGLVMDKPPIRLVMEYCPGGSVSEFLRKHKGKVSQAQKVHWCRDVARAMEYLASSSKHKLVHRDLAARNCLIGCRNQLKVSDFGLSVVGTSYTSNNSKQRLPIKWMAPESLSQRTGGYQFTTKSDVWSFGIVCWEIFADGREPWIGLNTQEAAMAIKQGRKQPTPTDTPSDIEQLMHQCWAHYPDNRPTFTIVRKRLDELTKDSKFQLAGSSRSSEGATTTLQPVSKAGGEKTPKSPTPNTSDDW